MIADKIFLTKGVGVHKEKLTSFEIALRNAGIAPFNLVYVSSIYPPRCKHIAREKGLRYLRSGQIVYCVMSQNATNEPHRLIAASIGLAIPADGNSHGYISEHHVFGQTKFEAGEYAEDLAASMLASTLGIEFDPDQAWNEKEQVFKMSGKIVKTRNITQSAYGNWDGLWTTVISTAVFIYLK
ncbi:arginine decarboxylase, pyruvoyl-dependent [Patescibacteria group bacterium]|nr:arginine decarboxylase, pyruvoyl-dependent [Patescibacteria group bacterium]